MVNQVKLIGAVVRSELRNIGKNLTPLLEVTLAGVDEVGEKRFAWYHQVSYLGKRAERLAELLAPGAGAVAVGQLEYRSWEGPDGEKRSRVEVKAAALEVFTPPLEHLDADSADNPRLCEGAVNRVTLVGNLTRDPEQGERGPVKAGLAVTEWVPGRGGKEGHEKAHFFDLVAWNGAGGALKECGKGCPLLVEGRLVGESWEAPDGQRRYATRVEVARVIPLLRPAGGPADPPAA